MARCRATTKKGTRCKNPAMEGSDYCGVHAEMHQEEMHQEEERSAEGASGADGRRSWPRDVEELAKVALGAALVGAIVILAITRRR